MAIALFNASNDLVATFTTIQDAINAASDGYKIILSSGTYTENLTVDKGVQIVGPNDFVAGNSGSRRRGDHRRSHQHHGIGAGRDQRRRDPERDQ